MLVKRYNLNPDENPSRFLRLSVLLLTFVLLLFVSLALSSSFVSLALSSALPSAVVFDF